MRKTFLMLAVATPLLAQTQQAVPANAGVSAAKNVWMVPHNFVVKSIEQTPESLFTFKPTPEIRALGALFAHVSDGENIFCSLALGEPMPNPADANEKSKHTKAEILAALKASAEHCDKAYAQTDAQGQIPADFFGQKVNRAFLLGMNGAHDYEHYGNMVTYLRLKGRVPPSSQ